MKELKTIFDTYKVRTKSYFPEIHESMIEIILRADIINRRIISILFNGVQNGFQK